MVNSSSVNRTSSTAETYRFQTDFERIQKERASNSQKVSSGQVASLIDVNHVSQVFNAQIDILLFQGAVDTNTLTKSYITQESQTVKTLTDQLQSIVSRTRQLVSPLGREDAVLQTEATSLLQAFQGFLNQSSDQLFLFGLDGIAAAPVGLSIGNYQGGNNPVNAVLDPDAPTRLTPITLSINQRAIQDAISCLTTIQNGQFDTAHTLGSAAILELAQLQQDLGTRSAQIDLINEDLQGRIESQSEALSSQISVALESLIESVGRQQELGATMTLAQDFRNETQRILLETMRGR